MIFCKYVPIKIYTYFACLQTKWSKSFWRCSFQGLTKSYPHQRVFVTRESSKKKPVVKASPVEQSIPVHPLSHSQIPLALHIPWLLHLSGQDPVHHTNNSEFVRYNGMNTSRWLQFSTVYEHHNPVVSSNSRYQFCKDKHIVCSSHYWKW